MANPTRSCSLALVSLFAFVLGLYNFFLPSWIWTFNNGAFICPGGGEFETEPNLANCGTNNFGSGLWAISYSSAGSTVANGTECPFTNCTFPAQTLHWYDFTKDPLQKEACDESSQVYVRWAQPNGLCDEEGLFRLPEEILIPRAFMVLSLIAVIFALVFGCLSVKQSVFLSNVASGLTFCGMLFAIVSLATYMDWNFPRKLIEKDGDYLPFLNFQEQLIVVPLKLNVGPGVLAMSLQILLLCGAAVGFRITANLYKKEAVEEAQLRKVLEDSKREKFERLEQETALEGVLGHDARLEMDAMSDSGGEEEVDLDGSTIRKVGSHKHAWIMDKSTGDMVSQKPSSRAILVDELGNEREIQIINAATAADESALEAQIASLTNV